MNTKTLVIIGVVAFVLLYVAKNKDAMDKIRSLVGK